MCLVYLMKNSKSYHNKFIFLKGKLWRHVQMGGKTACQLMTLFLVTQLLACTQENDPAATKAYPLTTLFEASKSQEDRRIEVAGYFDYWESDIPVLYATRAAFERQDGLYKSPIIFRQGIDKRPPQDMIGKVCLFMASIWYRGTVPTLDQAEFIECQG